MHKGIYCLLIRVSEPCDLIIGALGTRRFNSGWYIYTGSALGTGGLSRVTRHIRYAKTRYRAPKWHIDYLTGSPHAELTGAIYAETEERLECILAAAIGKDAVAGFGCSDCECKSHLFYRPSDPVDEIKKAYAALGLTPQQIPA